MNNMKVQYRFLDQNALTLVLDIVLVNYLFFIISTITCCIYFVKYLCYDSVFSKEKVRKTALSFKKNI